MAVVVVRVPVVSHRLRGANLHWLAVLCWQSCVQLAPSIPSPPTLSGPSAAGSTRTACARPAPPPLPPLGGSTGVPCPWHEFCALREGAREAMA